MAAGDYVLIHDLKVNHLPIFVEEELFQGLLLKSVHGFDGSVGVSRTEARVFGDFCHCDELGCLELSREQSGRRVVDLLNYH